MMMVMMTMGQRNHGSMLANGPTEVNRIAVIAGVAVTILFHYADSAKAMPAAVPMAESHGRDARQEFRGWHLGCRQVSR